MHARSNGLWPTTTGRQRCGPGRGLGLLLAMILLVPTFLALRANPLSNFAARAELMLAQAREAQQKNPTNDLTAWQFARAAFDRAEYATNDTQRATLAVEAISICRLLMERSPKLAAAHYYLGMNLGQLARTKTLGALKIVGEMEREFKIARDLDPLFDHAGPERNLGLLYLDAPGWPASIGSRSKARAHLTRARELAPDYPENRLNLVEAQLRWGEKTKARTELESLDELWPKAREHLKGENWEPSWADWERRREKARIQVRK